MDTELSKFIGVVAAAAIYLIILAIANRKKPSSE